MSLPNTLRSRFREHVGRRGLIARDDRIVVAVSGGVDSVVLLDLLALERDMLGIDIAVAHFNHGLRGNESDGDEEFVRNRARHYGIEFFSGRADTAGYARINKLGIQEAARHLRYEFFGSCARAHDFAKIATGHTANDNAETVLLNLFRGAGVRGLSGIPPFNRRENTIRPLLFARRDEVEGYAAHAGLPFRTDSSNAKDVYTRNLIRHHVLPTVQKEVNPNIIGTLGQTAMLFGELETFLTTSASEHAAHTIHERDRNTLEISLAELNGIPTMLRQYTIMLAAERLMGKRPEYAHVHSILSLSESDTGSIIPLGDDCHAVRDRETLLLRKGAALPEFRISVEPDRTYDFPAFRFSTSTVSERQPAIHRRRDVEYIDAGRIGKRNLVLRTWRDGDVFVPLGMRGRKKVSDFLTDEKVSVVERRSIPVLETGEGEIVWLCGRRIDERFKIGHDTRTILKLEFRPHADEKNRQG